jgi:hypothetical protein
VAIPEPLLHYFGVGGSDLLPSRKGGVPVSAIGRYNVYATGNHGHGNFFEFCAVVHLTLFPNPFQRFAAKQERVSDLLRPRNHGDAGNPWTATPRTVNASYSRKGLVAAKLAQVSVTDSFLAVLLEKEQF